MVCLEEPGGIEVQEMQSPLRKMLVGATRVSCGPYPCHSLLAESGQGRRGVVEAADAHGRAQELNSKQGEGRPRVTGS